MGYTVTFEQRLDKVAFDLFIKEFPYLLVEVDGSAHDVEDRKLRDKRKDRWASFNGKSVVRISKDDVVHDLDTLLSWLVAFGE
jgi:very-short-patch-repair endonuclease